MLEVTNHSLFSLHEMERKKKNTGTQKIWSKGKDKYKEGLRRSREARIEVLSDIRLKENWDDIATGWMWSSGNEILRH